MLSERRGPCSPNGVGLLRVTTQLKYFNKLIQSQLATLEQLSMQRSKERGHALQAAWAFCA